MLYKKSAPHNSSNLNLYIRPGDSLMQHIIQLAYWYVKNNAVGMQLCRKENSVPILDHPDLGMLPVPVLWTICQHTVLTCVDARRGKFYLNKRFAV